MRRRIFDRRAGRPTNILLAAPILLASELRPKRLAGIAMGATPGALFLLYLNWRLYGSPFATGQVDLLQQFSIIYVRHNLAHFAYWIFLLLGPIVLFTVAFCFFPGFRRRNCAIHALWLLVLTAFYAFYSDAGGDAWWWLRYLAPALPSLVIFSIAGLRYFLTFALQSLPSRMSLALAAAIVGLLLAWEAAATLRVGNGELFSSREAWKVYRDAPLWLVQNVPEGLNHCIL